MADRKLNDKEIKEMIADIERWDLGIIIKSNLIAMLRELLALRVKNRLRRMKK